jgi:small subunit ribosomal protein S16
MLKIKLARFGKKNQPHFRMVVNEARDKRDGSYVALLGHYAPVQTPKLLEINMEEYRKWLVKGAQPTDTVANLVQRFESGNPFPEKKPKLSKKAKAKLAAKAEEKKEKADAPAEATPAETKTEPDTDKK